MTPNGEKRRDMNLQAKWEWHNFYAPLDTQTDRQGEMSLDLGIRPVRSPGIIISALMNPKEDEEI